MHKQITAGVLILLMACGAGVVLPVSAAISPANRERFLADFQAGEAAFGEKRFDEAATHFQNALTVNPDQVRPRFRLGQALQALGRNEESVRQFHTLLEKNPNHIMARVAMAQGLINIGRGADARRQLEWILQVQPEHAEAGRLLTSLGGGSVCPAACAAGPAGPAADGREEVPAGFQPLPMRPGVILAETEPAPGKEQSGPSSSAKPAAGVLAAGRKAAARGETAPVPVPPPARPASGWKVSEFLEQTKGVFGVSLEYAKFCLEKGDLAKAGAYLDQAEAAALKDRDTRRFLETQIHRSLLNLYQSNIREFGQQLLRIKPLLSKETYTSFLEVYNRANTASSPQEVARLVGGVALGAEHHAVAAGLFGSLLQTTPDDLFVARLLAEAQIGMRDYPAAERTLVQTVRSHPTYAEGAMNLAKFYLTARFDPAAAAKHLEVVARLDPGDQRVPVLRSLIALVQGRGREGLDSLRQGLAKVRDPQVQILGRRLLEVADEAAHKGGKVDYAALLSLPGSRGSSSDDQKAIGEEFLKRGSYFLALKCFHEARDLAEIGRTYLALASHLFAGGDPDTSALAAGFGLKALREELKKNPQSGRANLYLALYHFERRDEASARAHVEAGLKAQAEASTRRHLRLLYSKVKG